MYASSFIFYIFILPHLPSTSRKRIERCGLQDRITVICTEITRDKYMHHLVAYLKFYNAHFDTVVSMLPSGDQLINAVCYSPPPSSLQSSFE